jgi:long-chain fatty acid transport protein
MKIWKNLSVRWFNLLLLSAIAIGVERPVFASGFALNEQSVRGLGNAFSGSVAVSEDAST